MSENVVPFFDSFVHDEDCNTFLEKVKTVNLEECVVIGHDESGKLYVGANTSQFEKIVFLLFRAECEMKRLEGHFPTFYDDEVK